MSRAAGHLTELEFVDLLDGALSPPRRAHVASCADCARRAEEITAILQSASGAEVPEPPPFFWTQLAARIRAQVATEPAPGTAWRRWLPVPALAAAAAAIFAIGLMLRPSTPAPVTAPSQAVSEHATELADDPFASIDADAEADEAWALVRSMAEDMDHEEMDSEGISPGPGAVERLTLQLTEPQRIELARLLDEQLRARPLPESAS
jgi:hypothetical protein